MKLIEEESASLDKLSEHGSLLSINPRYRRKTELFGQNAVINIDIKKVFFLYKQLNVSVRLVFNPGCKEQRFHIFILCVCLNCISFCVNLLARGLQMQRTSIWPKALSINVLLYLLN